MQLRVSMFLIQTRRLARKHVEFVLQALSSQSNSDLLQSDPKATVSTLAAKSGRPISDRQQRQKQRSFGGRTPERVTDGPSKETPTAISVLYKGRWMVPFYVLVRLKVLQLMGFAALSIPLNAWLSHVGQTSCRLLLVFVLRERSI